ncbi:MAG: hypothetical protein ACLFQV_12105, partial [Vulcanimicrobiota bacterium]
GFVFELLRTSSWSMPEAFINGTKGALAGAALGFITWIIIYNLKPGKEKNEIDRSLKNDKDKSNNGGI